MESAAICSPAIQPSVRASSAAICSSVSASPMTFCRKRAVSASVKRKSAARTSVSKPRTRSRASGRLGSSRVVITKCSCGGALSSREDLDEAIELTVSNEKDAGQEADLLKRIVKFGDMAVTQIMRSRLDVVAVNVSIDYRELLEVVRESGYSRIPVYEEDFDNVKGILYVKDLLGHLNENEDFRWQDLIRSNILFVPEAKKIDALLKDFQRQHLHMAIVVDEYGGGSGLVTLEDIMEEIIGDIKDEFDDEPELIYQQIDERNYVFEGKTLLNDVCRVLNIKTTYFDDVKGEADSLAGLVLEMEGELPQQGSDVSIKAYNFKILSVDERRIISIQVTLPESPPDEENE